MGLVTRDDGWRMPDWLWGRIAPAAPLRVLRRRTPIGRQLRERAGV
jgi:hypothetical protein